MWVVLRAARSVCARARLASEADVVKVLRVWQSQFLRNSQKQNHPTQSFWIISSILCSVENVKTCRIIIQIAAWKIYVSITTTEDARETVLLLKQHETRYTCFALIINIPRRFYSQWDHALHVTFCSTKFPYMGEATHAIPANFYSPDDAVFCCTVELKNLFFFRNSIFE